MFGKNFFHNRSIVVLIFCFVFLFNFGSSPIRPAYAEPENSPAYPPLAWQAIPNNGLNDTVWCFATFGDDLYVGGDFTQTVDGKVKDLRHIARFNTKTGTWHALSHTGLDDVVLSIEVSGSDLYVGGAFTATGDEAIINLNKIARYDTIKEEWHPLANHGLNYFVNSMAELGSDLYIGGNFTSTHDGVVSNLNHIARYNTASEKWYEMPKKGVNDIVIALDISGSYLYAGGYFIATKDGTLTDLGGIARYDTKTKTWHKLHFKGFAGGVFALAKPWWDGLYMGGNFTTTGIGMLTDLGNIAYYDPYGVVLHRLSNNGLSGSSVNALAVSGTDMYAGGHITATGDETLLDLGHIVRYNFFSDSWHPFPNQGLTGYDGPRIQALEISGDKIYVGGRFEQTGDGTLKNLNNIALCTLDVPMMNMLPLVFR